MEKQRLVLTATAAALLAAGTARAKPLDPAFTESVFVASPELANATSMAWAPDGSNRLFIGVQQGTIRIVKNGSLLPAPFATIQPIYGMGESGILGIAFDPDFLHTHYFFVFVTTSLSEQRIVRYTAEGDVAANETTVVDHLPTRGETHVGGAIGVGADGKVYWAIGDNFNGSGVNADLMSLASKVGRANLDGTVPSDNPFVDGEGPNADHVWARGFRNPFTMTFQPATGLLWLNVVGANYEQVFVVRRRDHGGWNNPAVNDFENTQPAGYITPLIKYRSHGDDNRVVLAAAMDGAVRAGGIVTFRTLVNHGFRLGEKIIMTGVEDVSFNGDVFVASVPTPTSFTARQAGPDGRSGGGLANTIIQGSCLTGGEFYDATQFPPAYRGNFFYGDYVSNRIMRATLDGATNTVTSVDFWATDISGAVDVTVGPDGGLYYVGHSSNAVFRTTYNATAQGLVVTPTNVWAVEGQGAALGVRLAVAPVADVAVSVARSAGDADVTVASGATLVFTPLNWSVPQTARIAVGRDADPDDDVATLTVGANGLAPEFVAVHVRDVDAPKLQISPASLAFDEGKTGSFTVALAAPPASNATVYVARTKGDLDVTLSTADALTFTTANWSVPQVVTMAAAEDQDAMDDRATLSLTPAGRTETIVDVTVRDNDGVAPDAGADAPPDVAARPVDAAGDVDKDVAPVADGPPDLAAPDARPDGGASDRELDAAVGIDAAMADGPAGNQAGSGGCGCRVGGRGDGYGVLVVALLLVGLVRRRERRQNAASASPSTSGREPLPPPARATRQLQPSVD